MKRFYVVLVLIIILTSFLYSETGKLEKKIRQYGEENGIGFIKPLVTAFGTNLNTGLYNTAKILKPFRFSVSFYGMLAFVPKEDKTFMATRPDLYVEDPFSGETIYLYLPEEIETATALGGDGEDFDLNPDLDGKVNFDNLIPKSLPNGGRLNSVPLFIPQFNMGLPYGNEIMLRIFPTYEVSEDTGEIGFWGIGLKHSIDQYLPGIFPIDIAVQGVYQYAKITDVLELTDFAVNAQISKKFMMWTLYGGLGYENTKLKAEYKTYVYDIETEEYEQVKVKFEVEGENDFRATIGFRYTLLLINFWTDYSICKYPVLNFGIGVSL